MGIKEQLKAEARDAWGVTWRAWRRTWLGVTLLLLGWGIWSAPWSDGAVDGVFITVLCAGFGAFHGVWIGGLAAAFRLCWHLTGWTTLIPLILFPLCIGGALWLGDGLIIEALKDLAIASVEAAMASGDQTIGAMPVARAGGAGAGLVILIVLIVWIPTFLGQFILSGAVWIAVIKLVVVLVGLALLGALVATLFSAPPVLVVAVARLRKRMKARDSGKT